jgi:hypothetical protein
MVQGQGTMDTKGLLHRSLQGTPRYPTHFIPLQSETLSGERDRDSFILSLLNLCGGSVPRVSHTLAQNLLVYEANGYNKNNYM